MSFFESKLSGAELRFREIEKRMEDPDLYSDPMRARRLGKERAELARLLEVGGAYARVQEELQEAREALNLDDSDEWREMAIAEAARLEKEAAELEAQLRALLLPKDPNDEKDIVLEIRPGIGGVEATLFAREMLRMYGRYAESAGWSFEALNVSRTDQGGVKDAAVSVSGDRVYSRLKFESGTHRVQRVPETESSRTHPHLRGDGWRRCRKRTRWRWSWTWTT